MKIQDTFPSVFTQISIFLTLHPNNYYHSLQCRRMISLIVIHHLSKQWIIEYRVKRCEQKFKHNYILDKSNQYEVVGIYTEISYWPGIQPTYEFRTYSNENENYIYRLEYFCLDLTLSEKENMIKFEDDCINESSSGNEEIFK
jgi:hypothetical protein